MKPVVREALEVHVGEIIRSVVAQALRDWRSERLALLDDGSPEAEFTLRVLGGGAMATEVVRVSDGRDLEPLLRTWADGFPPERIVTEARRVRARLVPNAMTACPANKTALLLGGILPPEPVLPLGDLYASEVAALTGRWSAPPEVAALAERAGGIDRLDDALRDYMDRRNPRGLERLPGDMQSQIRAAMRLGLSSRRTLRIVPKLGSRTIGVDLFE